MSGGRPKHPDKDLEKLICDLERAHWRVMKGKGYFKAYCPCKKHKKTIHLSPSGSNYQRNLVAWLKRETCWEGPS